MAKQSELENDKRRNEELARYEVSTPDLAGGGQQITCVSSQGLFLGVCSAG